MEADTLLHNITSHIQSLYKISIILEVGISEISVTEIYMETKKKWTNKGNDKQEEADTL